MVATSKLCIHCMRKMPDLKGGKCADCRSRKKRGPKEVQVFIVNGQRFALPTRPWCDCEQVAIGFTNRGDGVWVRPCCMRPAKEAYDKQKERSE